MSENEAMSGKDYQRMALEQARQIEDRLREMGETAEKVAFVQIKALDEWTYDTYIAARSALYIEIFSALYAQSIFPIPDDHRVEQLAKEAVRHSRIAALALATVDRDECRSRVIKEDP